MATVFGYADLVILSVGTQIVLSLGSYVRDNEAVIQHGFSIRASTIMHWYRM